MLRVLTVLGALLLGLIGLAMSLCGGGFLLSSGIAPFNLGMVLITVPCIVVGIALLWGAAKLLKQASGEPSDDGQ
jgi:choline-glycine betaine transporter